MAFQLRGNTIRGRVSEREIPPPRGVSESTPENLRKTSERYIGSEGRKRDLLEVFGGPFGDPLGGRFSSQRKIFLSETLGLVA